MHDPTPPRPIVDAANQQIGEQRINAAGGSINDPGPWLEFFTRYLWELDQSRTRRDDELSHEIDAALTALRQLDERFDLYQHLVSSRLAADASRRRTDRLLAVAALVVAVIALGIAFL